jgi:hypothetical protein
LLLLLIGRNALALVDGFLGLQFREFRIGLILRGDSTRVPRRYERSRGSLRNIDHVVPYRLDVLRLVAGVVPRGGRRRLRGGLRRGFWGWGRVRRRSRIGFWGWVRWRRGRFGSRVRRRSWVRRRRRSGVRG